MIRLFDNLVPDALWFIAFNTANVIYIDIPFYRQDIDNIYLFLVQASIKTNEIT